MIKFYVGSPQNISQFEIFNPTHLIQFVEPSEHKSQTIRGEYIDKIIVHGHDIETEEEQRIDPSLLLPNSAQVDILLNFLRKAIKLSRTEDVRVMIVCPSGRRCSASVAYIGLCLARSGCEDDAAQRLFDRWPEVNPNRRIIIMADILLGRDNYMIDCLDRAYKSHSTFHRAALETHYNEERLAAA